MAKQKSPAATEKDRKTRAPASGEVDADEAKFQAALGGVQPADPYTGAMLINDEPVPGTSADLPKQQDYLTMAERIAMSYGNPAGNAAWLQARHPDSKFSVNKEDRVVAERPGPNGKSYYITDADDSLLSDPLNTLAANAGKGLPFLAGMIGGGAGAAGGILSAPATGPGAVPLSLEASLAGGAAGSALGELLRQAIGRSMGVHSDSTDGAGLAKASRDGAGGTILDLALKDPKLKLMSNASKYAVEPAAEYIGPFLKGTQKYVFEDLGPRVSSFMTGIPEEAYLPYYKSPKEMVDVDAALRSLGGLKDVGKEAIGEAKENFAALLLRLQEARKSLGKKYTDKWVSTQPVYDDMERWYGELPASRGRTSVPPENRSAIEALMDKYLAYEKKVPVIARDAFGYPFETTGTEMVRRETIENLDNSYRHGGPLREEVNTKTEAYAPKPEMSESREGDAFTMRALQQILPGVRNVLREEAPALSNEIERYSLGKKSHDLLANSLYKEPEKFLDHLFGPNKGAIREAAQEIAPKAFDRARQHWAAKQMNTGGGSGGKRGLRNIVSASVGGTVGHQLSNDPFVTAIISAGSILSAQPQTHKLGYSLAGRLLPKDAFYDTWGPQMDSFAARAVYPSLDRAIGNSAWTLMDAPDLVDNYFKQQKQGPGR